MIASIDFIFCFSSLVYSIQFCSIFFSLQLWLFWLTVYKFCNTRLCQFHPHCLRICNMCRGSDEIMMYCTHSQMVTDVGIGCGNDFLCDLKGRAVVCSVVLVPSVHMLSTAFTQLGTLIATLISLKA